MPPSTFPAEGLCASQYLNLLVTASVDALIVHAPVLSKIRIPLWWYRVACIWGRMVEGSKSKEPAVVLP